MAMKSGSGQAVVLAFHLPGRGRNRDGCSGRRPGRHDDGKRRRGIAATLIGEDLLQSMAAMPPRLMITIAGENPAAYPLTKPVIRVGRGPDNDIQIDSRIVSREHARIERTPAGYQLTVLPEAGNPVLLDGRPLTGPRLLMDGDLLRIGSLDPGLMVTLVYSQPVAVHAEEMRPIRFGEENSHSGWP